MRRIILALAVMAAALPLMSAAAGRAGASPAGIGLPPSVPQDACQPDPTNPGIQTLHCKYGPLPVYPGQNLILIGPSTIESPKADGYMLEMTPNLIDSVTGTVPQIHEVHLHHGVWLSVPHGTDYNAISTPFMAAGEEKTISSPPPGYGYRVNHDDQWLLNYMLHNLTSKAWTVSITYDLKWINASSPQAGSIKPVVPLWFDNVGGFYPVYNPTQSGPDVTADTLSGHTVHTRTRDFSVNQNMDIVWLAGHVHPGGLRDDVRTETCAGGTAGRGDMIFSSRAVPNDRTPTGPDPKEFGSWDFRMTVTPPDFHYAVHAGDRVTVSSVYDTANPWYEAMGIVFGWGHPLAAGETPPVPFCQQPPSHDQVGAVTNTLPQLPYFGDKADLYPGQTVTAPVSGPPVKDITIANFDYSPGGLGQAPAPVTGGSTVTFTNDDAGAFIYHSVTTCDVPCNRDYGQSYPKANWTFDSGQLGYGIDGATAANGGARLVSIPDPGRFTDPRYWNERANEYLGRVTNPASNFSGPRNTTSAGPIVLTTPSSHVWQLTVPKAPVGTTYTYFCRVHPFMRGSLQVVN